MIVDKRIDRIDGILDVLVVVRERRNQVNVVIKVDDAELRADQILRNVIDICLCSVHTGILAVCAVIVVGHHGECVVEHDDAVAVELLSYYLDFARDVHRS